MASSSDKTPSLPVTKIMILGATGNVGSAILTAFQSHNTHNPHHPFHITVLTRTTSHAKTAAQLPPSSNLQVLAIDTYTNTPTLTTLLQQHNIEVLISTIATFSTNDQEHLISACVASGTVTRFFPSEFGLDTSDRGKVETYLPFAILKQENVDLLRRASLSTNGKLTWTAIITGAFFDWALTIPGLFAMHIPDMTAGVIDGGDIKYEATNMAQIGRAVVACLTSQSRFDETANQYVNINSFTTTQNEVIALIEKYTGRSMTRSPISAKELSESALATIERDGGIEACRAYQPTPEMPYVPGSTEGIMACLFGGGALGGMNQYSMRENGLWNDRLGLPREDIEETVKSAVERLGMLKA
ncbi:hypothetical protein PMZ80_007857 [Knufia obscura]|uniref:NmrA-like domain-containing protein n=2 Tax=Knufia TaxID=430999 RepID=A0AAN8EAT6_9EURO|nr:hypothetical protein PMZ80_007857 [Knufia obscura]KAK5949495.1 hypothetical protein OHC33_009488 [Knufia fluminis]